MNVEELRERIERMPYLISTLHLKQKLQNTTNKEILSIIPLRANYSIYKSYFGNSVEKFSDIAQITTDNIETHFNLSYLSKKCTLWFTKEQYRILNNYFLQK